MPKAQVILGLVAVVALAVAWWGASDGEPVAPPIVPVVPGPVEAPAVPDDLRAADEVPEEPTLAGAPDAAVAEVAAAAATRAVLTGRVIRLGSREPVADAAVSIRWEERTLARASSGADGCFRLAAEVPETGSGDWPVPLLVAEAEGMTTLLAMSPLRRRIASGDVGDLVLEPDLTIRGAVRGEDGERVAGARIVIEPSRPADGAEHRAGSWCEAALRQHAESDADGQFEFTGLPPRRFDIEVQAEGYVSAWYRGRAVADEAWLDVRLLRGRSVRVRVEGPDGAPVAGARVNLYLGYRRTFAGHYKTHLRLDRSTVTDASGRCTLTGLRDRNHHVTAQAYGLTGAADYVLPGWSETVVRLTPGWRSSRFAYEDGPGSAGPSSLMPPGMDGTFAWLEWPPEPEESAPPPKPPASVEPEAPHVPETRPPPPPHRARLHVTVLSADGVPMPDAYLGFEGPEKEGAITEKDGTEIVHLAPGRYVYWVSPMDFGSEAADVRGTVDAQGGVESRFVFRLPLVHSVPVEVQMPDGSPVPRAQLEILRGDETKRHWMDRDGRILLFAEKGQPFSLLSRPGEHAAAFLEEIELPVSRPVILRAPSGVRLSGRVLGPDGAPVFGAYVAARREGLAPLGEEKWTAWTDDRGAFVLEGPAETRYEVSARHRAFGASTVHLEIGPRPDPLTFRLKPLACLHGRLVDEEGAPVPGAEIAVRGANRGRAYGWVGSGDDGRFEIALPRGETPAELLVKREGFATRVVPVPPGAPGELEIRLAAR